MFILRIEASYLTDVHAEVGARVHAEAQDMGNFSSLALRDFNKGTEECPANETCRTGCRMHARRPKSCYPSEVWKQVKAPLSFLEGDGLVPPILSR